MWTSRKIDFLSRDIAKNNFSGIDISQGLDLEPPSLSPYFLLLAHRRLPFPLVELMASRNVCMKIKKIMTNYGNGIIAGHSIEVNQCKNRVSNSFSSWRRNFLV